LEKFDETECDEKRGTEDEDEDEENDDEDDDDGKDDEYDVCEDENAGEEKIYEVGAVVEEEEEEENVNEEEEEEYEDEDDEDDECGIIKFGENADIMKLVGEEVK